MGNKPTRKTNTCIEVFVVVESQMQTLGVGFSSTLFWLYLQSIRIS